MNRLALLLSWALALPSFAAEPIDLSLEDFKMYRHYLNALADPQVQQIKPEARTSAIAKDAGFKLKALQKAISNGEAAGDLKAKCEGNIREALEKTELSARIKKVEVDTSAPHAVAYFEWLNDDVGLLEEEASQAAPLIVKGCPIASSVQVWAHDRSTPATKIFQALISASAAARIKPEKAKEYGDTRYIRLFEKVKTGAEAAAPTP
jgi:hypothetical protein